MKLLAVIFALFCHLSNGFEFDNLPPNCERMTYPFCRRILPYNATRFPNLMGHRSQSYAVKEMKAYVKELTPYANCSKHAVFFLCSYFFPICLPGIDDAVKPCRAFCETVKNDCAALFHFWPDFVECDTLPDFSNHLCIQPESFVESGKSSNHSCDVPPMNYSTFRSRKYDYVIKLKVISIDEYGHHATLHGRAARIFKHGNVTIRKGRIEILADINTTCLPLRTGKAFLICGHEDAVTRKLQLSSSSLVEEWSDKKSLKKIRKWIRMQRRGRRGKQRDGKPKM